MSLRLDAASRLALLFIGLTVASVGLVNLLSGGSLAWAWALAVGIASAFIALAAPGRAVPPRGDPLAGRSREELEAALSALDAMPSDLDGLPDLTHPSTTSMAGVRRALRQRLAEMEEE